MPTKRQFTPPPPGDPAALREHRERLIALRDRLTAASEVAADRYLAALAGQLLSVLDALAQLPALDPPRDFVAELQARRAERLKTEGIPEPPARRAQLPRDR